MPHLHAALESYCVHKIWISCLVPILDSLVVRIPACHAGGRGSIPRQGENFCHIHDM